MKYSVKLSISLICCSLLVVSACGAPSTNERGITSTGPSKAGANAREELNKAAKVQLGAKSFRMRMVASGTSSMQMLIEFVAPDRYHFHMGPMEIVMIGNDGYTRIPGTGWTRSSDSTDASRDLRDQMLVDLLKSAEITFLASETIDGVPMRVYRYVSDAKERKTTGRIWIGATDYLPRKSEAETEATGERTKTKVTITYYDYNPNIRIEPPIYREHTKP